MLKVIYFKCSSTFGKYLTDNFFSKYKDYEKINVLDKYYSFVCNNKNAMKNFEDIELILKDVEMVFYLSNEDLFIKDEEKFYFLMYFNEKEDNK